PAPTTPTCTCVIRRWRRPARACAPARSSASSATPATRAPATCTSSSGPRPAGTPAGARSTRCRRCAAGSETNLRAVRVLTVVGNRPQFVKAAAVSSRLRAVAEEVLVHTGQHYDDALSRVFFDELALPRPEHQFALGGGSNSAQTARMLAALEGV